MNEQSTDMSSTTAETSMVLSEAITAKRLNMNGVPVSCVRHEGDTVTICRAGYPECYFSAGEIYSADHVVSSKADICKIHCVQGHEYTFGLIDTISIYGDVYTVEYGEYYNANRQPVIQISDENGFPSGVISVCIPDHPFLKNETAISSDVPQQEVIDELVRIGLASKTSKIAYSGYGRYPVIALRVVDESEFGE